jgi:hypothetical protein
VSAAFYALVPAWMLDERIERDTIAIFMLVAVLGGLAFQVPVGRLSDRFDRPIVLAALSPGFAVAAIALVNLPHSRLVVFPVAALLGGFMSTLYPVCVADAHDHMPADRIVAVSGQLILVSGLGSINWPADRHKRDGAFQHRRLALLCGRNGPALGPGCRSWTPVRSAADTPSANLRDPGATGGAPRARFAWRL